MTNTSQTNKIIKNFAGLFLIIMLCLAFFSMRGDSATMDELAHTPAGYSYVTQLDMRLNPEHPPLLKDLAGTFVWIGSKITNKPITFPYNSESWTEDINGQWEFGRELFYRQGNDADNIIFWGRLPMLLILLVLGLYIFRWTKELYGGRAALLATFLYALSPTFIAHGRYVTTDVGAAAAFFVAIYYFVKWLNHQNGLSSPRRVRPLTGKQESSNKKVLISAGIAFGIALLTKFSTVLLIPYFVLIVFIWALLRHQNNIKEKLFFVIKKLGLLLLIGIIGLILVWPVYQFHTWNYPVERQVEDTVYNLGSFGNRMVAEPVIWMANKPLLRPYAQYFTGVLMVIQRSAGGNTTYFMGEITNTGWRSYFPTVFLIKIPLALIILMLIALIYSIRQIKTSDEKAYKRIINWINNNFTEFALLTFFGLYWALSINSTLNIGVRHVLPIFPIIYILVAGAIVRWLKISFTSILDKIKFSWFNVFKIIRTVIWALFSVYLKYLIVAILLIWYAIGTFAIYPSFLTYFNESVGGAKNGYMYAVDSNLDWGQDLRRLEDWVNKNNIDKIYVDYFGGGQPDYYLGNKVDNWWGNRNPNELPQNSWLAISATFLQGGRGTTVRGFKESTNYYMWLNDYQPETVIGNSIFVYHINK